MKYEKRNNINFTSKEISEVMNTFSVSELTAKLILSKGFKDIDDIRKFIDINSIVGTNPYDIPNMKQAVERIQQAIDGGEKIAVFGDYDADGICAVSIIINVFSDIGYDEIFYYIPNRIDEGYGLNKDAIEYFKEKDCGLIITADCGISNNEEINFAKSLGIDVIVTDHHIAPEILPIAINVNPKLGEYNDSHLLCGAAVAMKLMCALFDEDIFYDYCDFAAIATIADMVELTGENRKIVKYGLDKINSKSNKNISYLVEECVKGKNIINEEDIAYFVAPAINATGRIDQAEKCVELFIGKAMMPQETASILANDNITRQKIEKKTVDEALKKIRELDLAKVRGIVLYDKDWHPGVLGIAASKIKNKYFRPVILFSKNNDVLVGSARSIDGIDMHKAIKYCEKHVKKYGGHYMAAGLSLEEESLPIFINIFNEYLSRYEPAIFQHKIIYDQKAKTKEINFDLLNEIEMMAPFGKGNSSPLFLVENISIENYSKIGKDEKHFRCNIGNSDKYIPAIAFSNSIEFIKEKKYDAIISINKNEWNSKILLQAQIKDIRPSFDYDNLLNGLNNDFDLTISQMFYEGKTEEYNTVKTEEVKEVFQKENFGNLLLIMDKQAYSAQDNYIKEIMETSDIRFKTVEKGKVYTNTILFAPDLENLDISNYDKVFLLSSYDIRGYYKILRDPNKVYIIVHNTKKQGCAEFTLTIEKLRDIFIQIKKAYVNLGIGNIINGTFDIEKWEIRAAIKIFSEVGLIAKNDANEKYFLTDKNKADMNTSKTFGEMKEG